MQILYGFNAISREAQFISFLTVASYLHCVPGFHNQYQTVLCKKSDNFSTSDGSDRPLSATKKVHAGLAPTTFSTDLPHSYDRGLNECLRYTYMYIYS